MRKLHDEESYRGKMPVKTLYTKRASEYLWRPIRGARMKLLQKLFDLVTGVILWIWIAFFVTAIAIAVLYVLAVMLSPLLGLGGSL